MEITYKDVKTVTHSTIGARTFRSVFQFVDAKEPSTWGAQKPRGFLRKSLYLAVYHDITFTGYKKLSAATRDWHTISAHSLNNNSQTLRTVCGEWGDEHIELGSLSEWRAAARHADLPREVQNTLLWVDSSDFGEVGKVSTSRRDNVVVLQSKSTGTEIHDVQ